ncbi:MAG: VWA domain-containing protein [Myxococcota bacterium]
MMSKPRTFLFFTAIPVATILGLALLKADASVAPTPMPMPMPTPTPTPASPPVVAGSGAVQIEAELDRSRIWVRDGVARMELTLRSDQIPTEGARVPTDLVVILDKSGSMSGQKMIDARNAAIELLAQLDESDRFALVSYDTAPRLEIPLSPATDASRESWGTHIASIAAGGSTNMRGGLSRAGHQLSEPTPGRARRAILISDGLPDSRLGLTDTARWFAQREAPLTTVGIGDDYDEQLMSTLADAGTGNFYWARQGADLATVFADEFSTARETVASGLTVTYQLGGAGERVVNAAGYDLVPVNDGWSFPVGSLYAGQERRFWLTLQLPDGFDASQADLGTVKVQWTHPNGDRKFAAVDLPDVQVTADKDDFVAGLSVEAWERSQIDEVYNDIRTKVSAHVQNGDKDAALALIDEYTASTSAMNQQVHSQRVADNILEAEQVRQEVLDNFTGADQAQRQNVWSKSMNMRAYSTRRSGQSKQY